MFNNIFIFIKEKIFLIKDFILGTYEDEKMEHRLYINSLFLISIILIPEGFISIISSPEDVLQYFIQFGFSLLFMLLMIYSKICKRYFIFLENVLTLALLLYLWFPGGGIKGTTICFILANLVFAWLVLSKEKIKIVLSSVLHVVALTFLLWTSVYCPYLINQSRYKNSTEESIIWFIEIMMLVLAIIALMGERSRQDSINTKNFEKQIDDLSSMIALDGLTGAFTKRYMFVLIENTRCLSIANNSRNFIAFIDIDDFKKINDRHGHVVGDSVLREFVHMIKQNIRRHDAVCRYGGDEFVILLSDINYKDAFKKINDLRAKIANNLWTTEKISLTVSIGMSEIENDDRDVEALIHRADTKMYHAKQKCGKNMVII